MKTILVTGAAGFIGSHLTDRLLSDGFDVVGIDNFNDYYDPKIKEKNIKSALSYKSFKLYRLDILNQNRLADVFEKEKPNKVIHLAARAGVRASIASPLLYTAVNVLGTVNLLKLSAAFKVGQFVFGSSSSVYGNSGNLPFSENDKCENIISPYGASKRSAEFFVEAFAKMTDLKCLILRFFTVWGPRGRPDMAPAIFTKAIETEHQIKQFGDGTSSRDYTYIDDIVDGIVKAIDGNLDFEIINLGNNHPVQLSEFIKITEKIVGNKAIIKRVTMQPGDVEKTWANIARAKKILGWEPKVDLAEGLQRYIRWLQKQ